MQKKFECDDLYGRWKLEKRKCSLNYKDIVLPRKDIRFRVFAYKLDMQSFQSNQGLVN